MSDNTCLFCYDDGAVSFCDCAARAHEHCLKTYIRCPLENGCPYCRKPIQFTITNNPIINKYKVYITIIASMHVSLFAASFWATSKFMQPTGIYYTLKTINIAFLVPTLLLTLVWYGNHIYYDIPIRLPNIWVPRINNTTIHNTTIHRCCSNCKHCKNKTAIGQVILMGTIFIGFVVYTYMAYYNLYQYYKMFIIRSNTIHFTKMKSE